ncbi:MAG: type I 3-dehydroquinate dehydratase [Planctomycetota bacterium]
MRKVIQTLVSPTDPTDDRVDAVELRLDLYPDLDVDAFVHQATKPVVAAVRRVIDGGRFEGSEEERKRLLHRAAAAQFVDLEVDADETFAPTGPRRVISFHQTDGMPKDLDEIFERCLLKGGDVVKIAARPQSAVDAFRLVDLPTGGLGLGEYGAFTRVLAPWTYCATEPIAPGMPTPHDLFEAFRIPRLGPAPALYGVVGDPIAHSQGPYLFNPAFEKHNLDAVYLRFRVSDLAAFWPVFLAHGGLGLSVTAPLKLQAAELASAPAEEVSACGAANTLTADGKAFNTDYRAFLDLVPPGNSEALVLGAGGAARSAVAALETLGYHVRVWNRTPERAAALGVEVAATPEPASVVVNTTPLDPPPAPLVIDLRYGPGIEAPEGAVDGLTFLRAQARHQYRIFTGASDELDE